MPDNVECISQKEMDKAPGHGQKEITIRAFIDLEQNLYARER